MSPDEMSARERADWLLDAVAMATQDRRYLRGDPQYDEVTGAAILMNGEKAILAAVRKAERFALSHAAKEALSIVTERSDGDIDFAAFLLREWIASLEAEEETP